MANHHHHHQHHYNSHRKCGSFTQAPAASKIHPKSGFPSGKASLISQCQWLINHSWFFVVLVLCHNYLVISIASPQEDPTQYSQILAILKQDPTSRAPSSQSRLHKLISSHVHSILQQIDKLQDLNYAEACDSVNAEKERHDLTNLVAQVTQFPSEELLTKIHQKQETILKSKTLMCNYTFKGLACDPITNKCTCYTGSRHEEILYEPVRENGVCRLDEMSRCYSPSYLVSRGANVIPCISGARCVGDVTGRRCVSPLMTENCHCQKPCPDGSFSNLMDELKKCIAKLDEISVLGFNDSCSPPDQTDRDDVVRILETSGSDSAGPIIRGIKKLLASERFLCSPEEQLVCDVKTQVCVCGPEKDGILYERVNSTCHWRKGSRCFPEDIYANATGSNGSCIAGTQCLMDGELLECDPNFEEPLCYCQDPKELEGSGMFAGIMVLLVLVIVVGGVLGFLVHTGKMKCPPGSSPANV